MHSGISRWVHAQENMALQDIGLGLQLLTACCPVVPPQAVDYWDQQEASVNGVLGGYGHLSVTDVRDSRAFLCKVGGSRASVVGMRWRLSKAKVEVSRQVARSLLRVASAHARGSVGSASSS